MALSVSAPAANAGTNGQQIQVCSSLWTNLGHAVIVGQNQNGLVTASPDVWIPWYDAGGGRCNPLDNWWWKGKVTIYWYFSNGDYYRSSTCTIPTYRGDTNWISCVGPNGETGPFDSTYKD